MTAKVSLPTSSFPVQDYVRINGVDSPGRAVIRGAGTPRKWDKREGYGASGGWLVFMGNGLVDFEIDIYLWDRDNHPQQWADFSGRVLKKIQVGKQALGVTIDHPILSWPPLEIKQCVITDVTQPEQDDTGGWAITIKCTEYRAPKAVAVKNTPTPDGEQFGPLYPEDKGEREILGLSAQSESLQNGSDKSGLF